MGNTWGDVSNQHGPGCGGRPHEGPCPPPVHQESFPEEFRKEAEGYVVTLWMPPPRGANGHRVAISDSFKPVAIRYLNWRWWLAEIPMRILARHAIKQERDRDRQGEEYIGSHHADD